MPLYDRLNDQWIDADLFQGVDAAVIKSFNDDWAPLFNAAQPGEEEDDAHWKWAEKARAADQNPLNGYEVFGIEANSKTQGLMLAVTGGPKCRSRHPEHPGKPLVYVDLVATAPWNRGTVVSNPEFKGVGRVLLMTAISLSMQEQFAGRIALHSLPGAETFYRDNMKMTDFGGDPNTQNLRYFELSESQSTQLRS